MTTTTEDLITDAIQEALKDKEIWKPEFLARKFWDLNAAQQSEFFNVLANLVVGYWSDMKWRWMQDSLSEKGKELINNMKAHTDSEDKP